jgi:homoserine dehydrogenase
MNKINIDNSTVNIGMIGLGYIGREVFSLIQKQKEYISKKIGKNLNIMAVAEININTLQDLRKQNKDIKFTQNALEIIEDENIDIVIELIGGLNPAYGYIMQALKKGKYVVTANKDLIAKKGHDLFDEAAKNSVDILFEASVGGGIPIIGPLKSSLASNNISKVVGIVNGTTNYILTKMKNDFLSFEDALKMAQELGYAEANPESDIEGMDAANKLAILSSIAFNSRVKYDDVYREGIKKITSFDIAYADELGYAIKLLAIGSENGKGINVRVHPALIPKNHILASIRDTYNAIYFYGNYVGEIMSFGMGAGDKPTASSIVGDIISIARNYDRENKRIIYGCTCFTNKPITPFSESINNFYILIDVVDKAGVLAKIAKVFGDNIVSIQSMIQKQIDLNSSARLIFITHRVINKNLYKSIEELKKIEEVKNILNIIRVEELDNNQ